MSDKDLEAQWPETCPDAGETGQPLPESPSQTDTITQEELTIDSSSKWSEWLSRFLPLGKGGDSATRVRTLENCPQGNPRMAAYLDSDENFMMYRRFGWIQARLLLRKQKEISDMERDLELQDGFPQDGGETDAYEMTCQYKEELLEAHEVKFTEYTRLLTAAQEMMRMQRPSTSEYRNLRHYCGNNADEVDSLEDGWILHKEDIVTLRPGREHAWLDVVLEKLLQSIRSKITRKIFCSKEKREKSSGPIVYYTRSRIDALAAAVITFTILLLLVIPTYVLYHLTSEMSQGSRTSALSIGVLLIFTLAFSAVLSLFTRARRHEILAAAAGYCAVLVVFLGNIPNA